MGAPTEADAKRATMDVGLAIKKLNDAIREASDFGVEVTISNHKEYLGARGSRSTLIGGDFKLVLNGLEDQDEQDEEESQPT